ncbi:hypothetical protein THIOKS11960009 [Thiocapsa sp. KS1]|nr:hypothetical protein THIOKS11960009 [Thiocapsa sp. KS1]
MRVDLRHLLKRKICIIDDAVDVDRVRRPTRRHEPPRASIGVNIGTVFASSERMHLGAMERAETFEIRVRADVLHDKFVGSGGSSPRYPRR